MHNPHEDTLVITHEDTLVITTKVANSLVHRLLVDSRSAVNILYWGTCQKIGLRLADLAPTTSPLYGFTRDSVIPEGTIKLAVTLGEPPRAVIVVIDSLTLKFPSAFNGILGRPLLKALKIVMSIHYLTMMFPIAAGIGQVWGRQCDSRECYSKSLDLTEMGPELRQAMEVNKIS